MERLISVVIPTYNRAPMLGMTVRAVLSQVGEVPFEIIIVDNNSTDETPALVDDLKRSSARRLRYVREPVQGLSFARNAGIANSSGDIVVFLDDDAIPQQGWLDALTEVYRTYSDAWCVGGRIGLALPEPHPVWFDGASSLMRGYLSWLDYGEGTIRLTYPLAPYGANFSVRRAALEQIGVFRASLGHAKLALLGGEEVDLCRRIHQAGGGVYYCSGAAVTHVIPAWRMTRRYFRRRAYWQGRTDVTLWFTTNAPAPGSGVGRPRASVMLKDGLRALICYANHDVRQAFNHEVALWKGVGYFHHRILLRREDPNRNGIRSQPRLNEP